MPNSGKLIEGKNIEFITEDVHADFGWLFIIRPQANDTREISEEFLNLVDETLDLMSSLVVPTELRYWSSEVSNNISKHELVNSSDLEASELTSSESLQYQDLLQEINPQESSERKVQYVSAVEVKDSKTKVFIKEGDVWIKGSQSELYKLQSRDEIVGVPSTGPIRVDFRQEDSSYSEAARNYQIDTVYTLRISSLSDIWLGNSPIEQVNRNRFGKVLSDIYETFDVIQTDFYADGARYRDSDIAKLVFEEKQNEEKLIREAKEWLDQKQC